LCRLSQWNMGSIGKHGFALMTQPTLKKLIAKWKVQMSQCNLRDLLCECYDTLNDKKKIIHGHFTHNIDISTSIFIRLTEDVVYSINHMNGCYFVMERHTDSTGETKVVKLEIDENNRSLEVEFELQILHILKTVNDYIIAAKLEEIK